MSLLHRVKEGIKKRRAIAKQRGTENQEAQAKIRKARLEGYTKGAAQRARQEGYKQGKAGQRTGGAMGTLGKMGGAADRALAYLNSSSTNPFDLNFGAPKKAAPPKNSTVEGHGSKSGTTITVDGTTIHISGTGHKKAHAQQPIHKKKKPAKIFNPLDF